MQGVKEAILWCCIGGLAGLMAGVILLAMFHLW